MIRLFVSLLGIPGLPVLVTLLHFLSASGIGSPMLVRGPVRSAVWEIQAKRNAEMEALKARIEVLQERATAANRQMSATLAALESAPR